MNGGGTGAQGNPRDGTPLIGKTGTAEEFQTWLIESSTKVATAAWVGNVDGRVNMFRAFGQLRYTLARETQRVANSIYGGDEFATPDNDLIKTVLTDLPNVVGMTIDDAKRALDAAGFEGVVGEPVDSPAAEGLVAAQSPGAGRVAGGSTVTINPSNGQGVAVPDVAGRSLRDAKDALRSAGFGNVVDGACTVDAGAGTQQKATGTTPAAGSLVNRNAAIAVDYVSAVCGGAGAPRRRRRRERQRQRRQRLVPASDLPIRPHRARRGGGGRRRSRDLGHRHRAVPVHHPGARTADPACRICAHPRAAPVRCAHGAVAAPQAGVDRSARVAGTRPHRQHRRQPRPRGGPSRSAPRVRSAARHPGRLRARVQRPRRAVAAQSAEVLHGTLARQGRRRAAGHPRARRLPHRRARLARPQQRGRLAGCRRARASTRSA